MASPSNRDSLPTRFIEDSIALDENANPSKIFFGDLPYVALINIFDKLNIGEKLRSMSVSKEWQSLAVASLQRETVFDVKQFSSARFNCTAVVPPKLLLHLLDTMTIPPLNATRLKRVDFSNIDTIFRERSGEFSCSAVMEKLAVCCPQLEYYDSNEICLILPFFANNCRNLVELVCAEGEDDRSGKSEETIKSLVQNCEKLERLEIPRIARTLVSMKYSPFEDARCFSLNHLRVRLYAPDVAAIAEKFPRLEYLVDTTNEHHRGILHQLDTRPLKALSLVTLDLIRGGRFGIKLFCSPEMRFFPLSRSIKELLLGDKWEVDADDPQSERFRDACSALRNIGSSCPELLKLSLERAGFLPLSTEMFDGSKFLRLRALDLRNCRWPSDVTFSLPNLRSLMVGCTHKDALPADFGQFDLLAFLPQCPKLWFVNCYRIMLKDDFFSRWCEVPGRIARNPKFFGALHLTFFLTCRDFKGQYAKQEALGFQDHANAIGEIWEITAVHTKFFCSSVGIKKCRKRAHNDYDDEFQFSLEQDIEDFWEPSDHDD